MNKAQAVVRRLVSFARLLWAQPRVRAFLLICATVFFVLFATLGVSFSYERHQREAEMAEISSPTTRSAPEIRGLMSNMIRDHIRGLDNASALIPCSMRKDAACAGAVISMTNFLIGGQPRLRSSSAWTFEQENRDAVTRVIDIGHLDFQVGEERITRTHDRMWQLARYRLFGSVGQGPTRTSDGIYIIGYRYDHTRADPSIIHTLQTEGGEHVGVNSHLALLLGRMDGHWWVYHFFHDPEHPDASPFRIDAVDDPSFTGRFHMVRIWRVNGVNLGLEEAPIAMVNPSRPYTAIRPYLGLASRLGDRVNFVVNTATMGLFGGNKQFPRIVRIPEVHGSSRVAINNPSVGRSARPTANTVTARRPPLERQRRVAQAHISRRHAPPPRVGAHNDRRRSERHAERTSHARR